MQRIGCLQPMSVTGTLFMHHGDYFARFSHQRGRALFVSDKAARPALKTPDKSAGRCCRGHRLTNALSSAD
jgi:hypothetical protein